MKSRQVMFFAVFEDLEPIMKEIESLCEIKYYKMGLHDNKDISNISSIFKVSNVGFTSSGDWNRVDNYLILKKPVSLNVREVPQKTGEIKFAIDQLNNSKSIELKLGGIYLEKKNVIVAGRFSTVSEDNDSSELFKLFAAKYKREFKKIGAFYVGKNAQKKLMEGWRLVTNEKSPREYDLAIN